MWGWSIVSASGTGSSLTVGEEVAAARQMQQLITRSLLVQAIPVACRLGIPDLLASAARTAEELAEATGAHPGALRRLLRALNGLDVVTADGDRFALTSLGRTLCSGPRSAAASVLFLGSPSCGRRGELSVMRCWMEMPPSGTCMGRDSSTICRNTRTSWQLSKRS